MRFCAECSWEKPRMTLYLSRTVPCIRSIRLLWTWCRCLLYSVIPIVMWSGGLLIPPPYTCLMLLGYAFKLSVIIRCGRFFDFALHSSKSATACCFLLLCVISDAIQKRVSKSIASKHQFSLFLKSSLISSAQRTGELFILFFDRYVFSMLLYFSIHL